MGSGYWIRLSAHIGKGLTTDETSLEGMFNGMSFFVKSAKKDMPLNKASRIVMTAHGFSTEEDARQYGEHLQRAAHMAGLHARVGVDGRSVGDSRIKSGVFAGGDKHLRDLGVLQPDEISHPDIYGLAVIPEDNRIRIFQAEAKGRVTHDPRRFILAIEEAASNRVVSRDIEEAVHVLNLALINESNTAKVVLAISAIEAMAAGIDDEGWTKSQREMIRQAISWMREKFGYRDDASEVADAIQRVHHYSLRQQARRLLKEHDLLALRDEWEDVYDRRSKLFHGGARDEDDEKVIRLAGDAIVTCRRIVLSIARSLEGKRRKDGDVLDFEPGRQT